MPGFSATQLNYKARSGNSVVVMIGDQTIAFAQTVTHTFDLGTEGFYGVGSSMPQEIQQLKTAPSITIDNFNLTTEGLRINQGNTLPLAGFLSNNQFNISLIDGATQQPLFTYIGCVAQSFNESVPANQPITDAVSFLAMDVLDGGGTSIFSGPNALTVSAQTGQLPQTLVGGA